MEIIEILRYLKESERTKSKNEDVDMIFYDVNGNEV